MCGKYPSATEDPCWSLEDRLWALLKHNNLVLIQFYVILKTFLVLTHFCKHLPSFGGTGNIPPTSAGQWVTHTSTFWWGSFKTHIRQKGVSQKKSKQLALTKGYLNHPRAVQMLDREMENGSKPDPLGYFLSLQHCCKKRKWGTPSWITVFSQSC
jgi:hypothetical protein